MTFWSKIIKIFEFISTIRKSVQNLALLLNRLQRHIHARYYYWTRSSWLKVKLISYFYFIEYRNLDLIVYCYDFIHKFIWSDHISQLDRLCYQRVKSYVIICLLILRRCFPPPQNSWETFHSVKLGHTIIRHFMSVHMI